MSRIAGMMQVFSLPNSKEFLEDMQFWFQTRGPWWATSLVAHAVVFSGFILFMGGGKPPKAESDAYAFDSAELESNLDKPQELTNLDFNQEPEEPTEAPDDNAIQGDTNQTEVDSQQVTGTNDDVLTTEGGGRLDATTDLGGLNGFDVKLIGPGPQYKGADGLAGKGLGNNAGSGGAGVGFGARNAAMRKAMVGRGGGTKGTEQAVRAALYWLANHQDSDGKWSLKGYKAHCVDATCTGDSLVSSSTAATALALLPFLAAGQTHHTNGPYKSNIEKGIYWLASQQDKGTGDLGGDAPGQQMYVHGIATICLCEAFGLTQDPKIGAAAEAGIQFIRSAQIDSDGGWRYKPKDGTGGDTSVAGWQVMALKSGRMAGLTVDEIVFENAKKFLKKVSVGGFGGQYGYQPGDRSTPRMNAVGLLCAQYLGAPRDDPGIKEGANFFMQKENLPQAGVRDAYYWYYATQVMHNLPGPQWDAWNRKMRRVLIDTQVKAGCATGSWDPTGDEYGAHAGRLYTTSLSCLTLEIYYRYLPLYQLDAQPKPAAPAGNPAETPAPAAPAAAE